MPTALPHYYSSLVPFREAFASGLPILTYHKLGPRPRRVRLKGLYVSNGLFDRQVAELRAAGYHSVWPDHGFDPGGARSRRAEERSRSERLDGVSPHPGRLKEPRDAADGAQRGQAPAGPRTRPSALRFNESRAGPPPTLAPGVVITFDDGFRNVFEQGLPILARHGFCALVFLLADLLGRTNTWEQAEGETPEALMDEVQVREWLAAGHRIGSHSCTHPWLTRLPVPAAREEIASSRRRLEDRFGVAVEHFCYPYGDWNEAVRELVAEAGYRTACTVEPGVNRPETPRLALKRFTARYPSRNLRVVWEWLRRRFGLTS